MENETPLQRLNRQGDEERELPSASLGPQQAGEFVGGEGETGFLCPVVTDDVDAVVLPFVLEVGSVLVVDDFAGGGCDPFDEPAIAAGAGVAVLVGLFAQSAPAGVGARVFGHAGFLCRFPGFLPGGSGLATASQALCESCRAAPARFSFVHIPNSPGRRA